MTGQTVSHYRILERLGGGGMGVVYRAEDTRLKRTVALKFLSPELTKDDRAKQRFINEARAASQLDHPNICTIHEIEETDDGQLFLVLSCYDGETVRERLERGPMPVDEAIGFAVHVAKGLSKAHEKGIIHRDIKPANIFLTDDGRAKILDFGLAKLAGQTRLTRAGGTMGTVAYMSPEQAHGDEVGPQSDLWSLGVVLYEALSGVAPFPGDRPESVLYSVVHEEPPELRSLRQDVPAALEAIISKCLDKDPSERFASADELVSALESVRDGRSSGSSLIDVGSTTMIEREPRRRAGLGAGIAVLVLAFAGLFGTPGGRQLVGRLFGGARLPELRQIAVLPFVAAGETDEAFARGLSYYLGSRLGALESLDDRFRVIPADEVLKFNVRNPEQARGVSGATLALLGTVERQESKLAVAFELVDTATSRRLASWEDRDDLANIASFQDDPVAQVARRLGLEPPMRSRGGIVEGGTTVPGAFESYVTGLGWLHVDTSDTTGHLTEAIANLEGAVSRDPSFALARADLARAHWEAYLASKDPEEATLAGKSARLATDLDDSLPAAHVVTGLVAGHEGRYDDAVKQFRLALEAEPTNVDARRQLADTAMTAGDYELTEVTYREAVDDRQEHWWPHFALGWFYYARGRYDDALRVLSEAAALAPGNPDVYTMIGLVYRAQDRLDEAWAMMEKSAEVAPSPLAYSNLGTLYFERARYADAARMYEKALDLDNSGYVTWGNLASAYDIIPNSEDRATECYAKALDLAREELKLRSDNPVLLSLAASYTAELGDTLDAMSYIERAVALEVNDEEVEFRIGIAYEALGRRVEALDWIEKALMNGCSRELVESAPSLRELCSDERYRALARRVDASS
jgi:tetratricopeptide (TPR) repeat protein